MKKNKSIIVVGAGAAGMMAAAAAAEAGCDVLLLERNEKPGKKIYITGKGRCNLTNACDTNDFFDHVVRNPKFLYSAVYSYDQSAVINFMEKNGCPTKIERGNRVFPVSDHASDVTRALVRFLREKGIQIRYNVKVTKLLTADAESGTEEAPAKKISGVRTQRGEELYADAVIVCTGGKSYPTTGSTGDGVRFADSLGIKVHELAPSLVPFNVKESWCSSLQGLALKNVAVEVVPIGKEAAQGGDGALPAAKGRKNKRVKPVYKGFGEMLFTHFGVSGPLLLTASCYCDFDRHPNGYILKLDSKPALTAEQLQQRLQREVESAPRKRLTALMRTLYPARMAEAIASLLEESLNVSPDQPVAALSGEAMRKIAEFMKCIPITLSGMRGFAEAIVCRGGIDVREIDPSTMECRKVSGLYFAGETIDVDAHTGGYNLQIAWSTGHLAGMSAAEKLTCKA